MPDAAHEQYMVMSSVPDGDLAKKIPMMRLMESKTELGAYLSDGFSLKKGRKSETCLSGRTVIPLTTRLLLPGR